MLLWNSPVSRSLFAFSVLALLNSSAHAAIQWNRFTDEASREVLKSGKYKGETLEIGQRRALVMLTVDEKRELKIPVDQLAFANFRHNRIFYVAYIPGIYVDQNGRVIKTDGVVDHIGYSEKHWAAEARPETRSLEAHSELVFHPTAGHGVILVANQDARKVLARPSQLKDAVVLSVEAVRSALHVDAPFFPDAVGPNFAIVHRIVSDHERNLQHMEDKGRRIDSDLLSFANARVKAVIEKDGPALPLGSVMDTLLVAALLRSERMKRTETYDIAKNNCTNSLFHLLDDVVDYNNGAGIDKEKIRQGVNRFLKVEVPKIRDFLTRQKQFEEVKNNPELFGAFQLVSAKLDSYAKKELTTADLDDSFMSSLPAFIKPHLRARGILIGR